MQCFEVTMPDGTVEHVPLEVTGLNEPYLGLHKRAPSGWATHAAYSHSRFDSAVHTADVAFYDSRGQKWFGEIFHDTIEGREQEEGEKSPGEGFVPVTYTTNPGRAGLITKKLWLPPKGLYLPVKDKKTGYRFFKPGTLVPERIAEFSEKTEAEKAFIKFGLPQDEISGFYRWDDYRDKKSFGGRYFAPAWDHHGRFSVRLCEVPAHSGRGGVGSRPAYIEREIIMRI